MQVNDLIFKELIKRGYSLEGKTRVWNIADSKLWYLSPEQAQGYLELEHHKDYSKYMFETEIEMLNKYMPAIADQVLNANAVNIIDIGCGDGKKAVPIIEELHKRVKIRYCPIDISSYMVSKAIEKITKLNKGEVVQFQWNISDFDNLENVASILRNQEYRQNFLLFLGGTLGNFEMHEVMYEIMEAMEGSEDYLLIGVALTNAKPEDIIASYKQGLMDQFLSKVLTQIGFKREEIEFGVKYKNSRVEMYYTLLKDVNLKFGGRTIFFSKGDQILIAVSHRYKEAELKKAMKIYFKNVKYFFNREKTWVLVLCKK
ncbi:hypothetical protein FJZ18_01980 [Candidatus Pacearchaeota archaeon]|nr:hypothetical protein [Candidatus Pacearchaeota archaeon]